MKRRIPSSQLDKETTCDYCGGEHVARRAADSKAGTPLPNRHDGGLAAFVNLAGREPADNLNPDEIDGRLLEQICGRDTGEAPPGLVAVLAAQGGRGDFTFSPDGRRIAAAVSDRRAMEFGFAFQREDVPGGFLLFDARTGAPASDLDTGEEPPAHCESVTFSPDGRYLVATDGDLISIWDMETGEKVETLPLRDFHLVSTVAFSPDGRKIAAGCDVGGSITVWDGCLVLEIRTQQDRVRSIAFHPDGRRIASAGEDARVRLWDVASGGLLRTFRGHRGAVLSVTFSPFGSLMASAGADGEVKLWNASGGEQVRALPGHAGGAWSVAFSPHGDRLVSSGADGATRIWSAANGELVHQLALGPSNCLAFSPTGRFLGVHHKQWICIARLSETP
jgi:WD40 repeat protein